MYSRSCLIRGTIEPTSTGSETTASAASPYAVNDFFCEACAEGNYLRKDFASDDAVVWLLVTTLGKFALATEFIPGKRLPDMNDKTCKSGDELFAAASASTIHCLLQCGTFSGDGRCTSAFYRESDGQCQGCNKWYTTPAGLPDLAGTVYIGKGAAWDVRSDSIDECMFPNMQPKNGVCRCRPGWPYNQRTRQCVMQCDHWGTTYEEWSGTVLYGHGSSMTLQSSVPECIEKCNSMTSKCMSIDFNLHEVRCYTNDANVALAPTDYDDVHYYTHFTRNCA